MRRNFFDTYASILQPKKTDGRRPRLNPKKNIYKINQKLTILLYKTNYYTLVSLCEINYFIKEKNNEIIKKIISRIFSSRINRDRMQKIGNSTRRIDGGGSDIPNAAVSKNVWRVLSKNRNQD